MWFNELFNQPQQAIRTELNIRTYTVTDLIMLRYKAIGSKVAVAARVSPIFIPLVL